MVIKEQKVLFHLKNFLKFFLFTWSFKMRNKTHLRLVLVASSDNLKNFCRTPRVLFLHHLICYPSDEIIDLEFKLYGLETEIVLLDYELTGS